MNYLNCINKAEMIRCLFQSLTVIDAVSWSESDSASMMVWIDLEFIVSTSGPPPFFSCSWMLSKSQRFVMAELQSDVSRVPIKKKEKKITQTNRNGSYFNEESKLALSDGILTQCQKFTDHLFTVCFIFEQPWDFSNVNQYWLQRIILLKIQSFDLLITPKTLETV